MSAFSDSTAAVTSTSAKNIYASSYFDTVSDRQANSVMADMDYIDEQQQQQRPHQFPGALELLAFHDWYRQYHGYAASVVCVLGIIANVVNIIVLSRRTMRSPINCILSGLAVSDGLTMVAYLPFALRFYVMYGVELSPERNQLAAVKFLLFYARFSVVVHTTSIWLTVVLATFRYVIVRFQRVGVIWCTLPRAELAVIMVYVASFIVCLPNFATVTVRSVDMAPPDAEHNNTSSDNNNNKSVVMWTVMFKLDTIVDRRIHAFNFWVQAIAVRLVPCLVLTVLSALLVHTMRRADARLRSLDAASARSSVRRERRHQKTNRTTRMLLTVVILFLVTELPQGITNILSGISRSFVDDVYLNLGDLIDILALVNNGVNFILYCTMSRQFRKTFVQIFWCRPSVSWSILFSRWSKTTTDVRLVEPR